MCKVEFIQDNTYNKIPLLILCKKPLAHSKSWRGGTRKMDGEATLFTVKYLFNIEMGKKMGKKAIVAHQGGRPDFVFCVRSHEEKGERLRRQAQRVYSATKIGR